MRGPGQVPRDWHPSRQIVEALCSDRKAPGHLSRRWVPPGTAAPPLGSGWGSQAETAGFRQGEMGPSTQAVSVQSPGSQDWLMGRQGLSDILGGTDTVCLGDAALRHVWHPDETPGRS